MTGQNAYLAGAGWKGTQNPSVVEDKDGREYPIGIATEVQRERDLTTARLGIGLADPGGPQAMIALLERIAVGLEDIAKAVAHSAHGFDGRKGM